jgi:hypothetical protein
MEDCKRVTTPMQTSCKFKKDDDSMSTDHSSTGQCLVAYYMLQHLDHMKYRNLDRYRDFKKCQRNHMY